jgi:MoaA/NifB/PqqE/SkfB family radical SAM enzyme
MLIGFAITEHCNLRCPHCIRDDVTTVRSLEPELIGSILDQARPIFGPVAASFTGGEPLLHDDFERIVVDCSSRSVPYRFVSNAWHVKRIVPLLRQYPPASVRLSLSGASEATHDADRGRDSYRRVLLGVAMLTAEKIPCYLSMVIDRRNRRELRTAADLAESLGCLGIGFILPQPTPGSAERDSDLGPDEYWAVTREIQALRGEGGRRTEITIDYGYPFDGAEHPCDTFSGRRLYVDTRGRLCTCCQLSNYGTTETEVVADLHDATLADGYEMYRTRLGALRQAQRPTASRHDITGPFPCLRCCRASGKLSWLRDYSQSPWHLAAARSVTPAV